MFFEKRALGESFAFRLTSRSRPNTDARCPRCSSKLQPMLSVWIYAFWSLQCPCHIPEIDNSHYLVCYGVNVQAFLCDECSILVPIPTQQINGTKPFKACKRLKGIIDSWKRIGILVFDNIKFPIVNTKTNKAIPFFHKNNWCSPWVPRRLDDVLL